MDEEEEGIGDRPQSSRRVPGPAGEMQEEWGSLLELGSQWSPKRGVLLAHDPGCQLRSWLRPWAAFLGDPGPLISPICLTASPAALQPNTLQSLK